MCINPAFGDQYIGQSWSLKAWRPEAWSISPWPCVNHHLPFWLFGIPQLVTSSFIFSLCKRPGSNSILGLLFVGVDTVVGAFGRWHFNPFFSRYMKLFHKEWTEQHIDMDFFASADDLTVAAMTSVIGKARRFLLGVNDVPVVGLENKNRSEERLTSTCFLRHLPGGHVGTIISFHPGLSLTFDLGSSRT